MRKCISLFLVILLIGISTLLYALDKAGNFESQEEHDRYIADTLKKMAMEMSSQMPMMMDTETRADFVLALGKTINFRMTLINVNSTDVNAEEFNKTIWSNVNDIACKNKATRTLIDAGVNYVYIYYGKNGRMITRVALDKYKCNSNHSLENPTTHKTTK